MFFDYPVRALPQANGLVFIIYTHSWFLLFLSWCFCVLYGFERLTCARWWLERVLYSKNSPLCTQFLRIKVGEYCVFCDLASFFFCFALSYLKIFSGFQVTSMLIQFYNFFRVKGLGLLSIVY